MVMTPPPNAGGTGQSLVVEPYMPRGGAKKLRKKKAAIEEYNESSGFCNISLPLPPGFHSS